MTVFDSSALLALLLRESGSADVEAELVAGQGFVGAANWSEIAAKVGQSGDWGMARALLLSYGLKVVPVTEEDAEVAARFSRQLSLGDRLCLALGQRRSEQVVTADREWAELPGVRLIR